MRDCLTNERATIEDLSAAESNDGGKSVLWIHRHAQNFGGRSYCKASNPTRHRSISQAIWCILGAFVFDFLDGRLARLGGHESAFGREFDSLADIVSFGLAPALMVYRVVFKEFPHACWIIAFVYLACGALRLARFNSAAAKHDGPNHQNTFTGFPIPAAAGLIASITLFLLWLAEGEHHLGNWRFVLPPLLLFLSFMMFSRFQYPSFKAINWKTTKSIPRFLIISLVLVITAMNYEWMPAVLFLAYLLYGVLRPWLSREWRSAKSKRKSAKNHRNRPSKRAEIATATDQFR